MKFYPTRKRRILARDEVLLNARRRLSVASSEPLSDSSNLRVIDAHHLLLIAERLGSGTGRAYTRTIAGRMPPQFHFTAAISRHLTTGDGTVHGRRSLRLHV